MLLGMEASAIVAGVEASAIVAGEMEASAIVARVIGGQRNWAGVGEVGTNCERC